MGKIRVKTFGDEEQEKKELEKQQQKKEAKIAEKKAQGKIEKTKTQTQQAPEAQAPKKDSVDEILSDLKSNSSESAEASEPTEEPKKEVKKTPKNDKKAFRSKQYDTLVGKVDKKKVYGLKEALELLGTLQRTKFDETVELHINTTAAGISGNVTLPHGTGKKTRVAIADDALIAAVEKGKIEFDILVATPDMMPKLAKVARILGPKGLMPNPKNGTVTSNPAEIAKKYEGGQISFKTEAKNPLLHLTVGKISFGNEKLTQNIEEMLKAVKRSNIVDVTLKSTMSPGIKIKA